MIPPVVIFPRNIWYEVVMPVVNAATWQMKNFIPLLPIVRIVFAVLLALAVLALVISVIVQVGKKSPWPAFFYAIGILVVAILVTNICAGILLICIAVTARVFVWLVGGGVRDVHLGFKRKITAGMSAMIILPFKVAFTALLGYATYIYAGFFMPFISKTPEMIGLILGIAIK